MRSRVILAVLGATVSCAVLGCGGAVEPSEVESVGCAAPAEGTGSAAPEQPGAVEIVAALRDRFLAACSDRPSGSVRIFDPLHSGAHADVSCAAILDGDATGVLLHPAPSASPGTNGEAVGEAPQEFLSPIGATFCGLFTLGFGLFMSRAVCDYPGAGLSRS